jgi:N-acetylglucosamine-6-sulfatase
VDLAPTVLDLAGVKPPADVHGRSLVPLLRGEVSGWRTAILTEYFREKNYPRFPTWQAVRTDRWKYVRYPGHPDWDELYDLKADPAERKNRAGDGSAREAVQGLKAELDRLLAETGGK